MTTRHLVALSAVVTVALLVRLPAQTADVKAFTGARLIDGTAGAPIENASILVRSGRIAAVGPAERVSIPADAARTSLAGKTVIPG
jgi:imidazolonepropionase-like amidohydrolase